MAEGGPFADAGHWILPEALFEGGRLRRGRAVYLEGGRVLRTADAAEIGTGAPRAEMAGVLSPGFVDLQVNGGGGRLVNTTPTPEAMIEIAAAHRRFGTVAILPTVITDTDAVLDAAAEAAVQALGAPGIAGLHIEGPHLSVARKGTHDAAHVRPFAPATLRRVRRLRDAGVPVMITVAAEAISPADVAALAEMGAVVSIGHSDARAEDVEPLIGAGLRAATHLFNAMSPLTSREPGVVGAVIDSELYAGIICDGIHVDDRAVAIACRARPRPDRMMLVSDAMPTVGGPDRFRLYDDDIALSDGRLVNREGGLAGAHVTQAEGVLRLAQVVGLGLEAALAMAITHPAEAMRLPELAAVEGRLASDLICLAPDGAFLGTPDARHALA